MVVMKARLVGGLFDGDEGSVLFAHSEVYAFACGASASRCPARGIHWLVGPTPAAERYVLHQRLTMRDRVLTYVHCDSQEATSLICDPTNAGVPNE
jgi:hypothetical protein